ncbi:MAG: hypothetical protein K8R57_06780 [Verrucomicrobia bacterium]|nr:hypothetical protein [Verrucomicrobiota bacterium]
MPTPGPSSSTDPALSSSHPPVPSTAGTNDPLTNPAAPSVNPSAQPSGTNQATSSTNSTNSPAAMAMTAEMQKLKDEGKLTSNRAVAAAVRKVITDNSIQHDIPAPMGAKVIAVHKHPGDLVHIGDKIVTLLVNGKELPILAKQEGIMQTINVSKGGIIGNSRPRAAKTHGEKEGDKGSIVISLRPRISV